MPYRILHVIDSLHRKSGGTPVSVASLATAQYEAGLLPTIARGDKLGVGNESITSQQFQDVVVPIQIPRIRPRLGELAGLVREFDVVHVHGTWRPFLALALYAAQRAKVPCVLTPHGTLADWAMSRKAIKKELALALGWGALIRRCHVVIALNPEESRMMQARFPGIRTATIPNGVSIPASADSQAGTSVDRFVLFLAHLNDTKRPDLLVDAFAIVAAKDRDLNLVMAGPDKGSGAQLRRMVCALGLENRIAFVGGVYGDRKAELMHAAVCLVHPTRQEACSMSILEALASGLPVVTTPEANLPSLARVGAGLIVEPDAAALADAILQLAGDTVRRAAMSTAGRALATAEHSWPQIERRVFAQYQSAMAETPATPA